MAYKLFMVRDVTSKMYGKLLLDMIEAEKQGTDFVYPAEERGILEALLKGINDTAGTDFHFLAELAMLDIPGAGNIVKDHILEFSSEPVRAYLIHLLVSDRVKGCAQLLVRLYTDFRSSELYKPRLGTPLPAHVYVRYDDAFRRLKPKQQKEALLEFAHNPYDFFYLPFTMQMLASWKLPEMQELLLEYLECASSKAEEICVQTQYGDYFPERNFVRREIMFTAIAGLKHYPSVTSVNVLSKFVDFYDVDLRAAARKVIRVLQKGN